MSWHAFCPKITKGKEHRAWSQISLNSFPCCLVYYLCYPGHLTSFHWSLMHSCKMSICIAYPRSIKLHCGDKHCPNRNGSQRQRSTSCLGCRSFWGQLQLWPHFPSSGGTKRPPLLACVFLVAEGKCRCGNHERALTESAGMVGGSLTLTFK